MLSHLLVSKARRVRFLAMRRVPWTIMLISITAEIRAHSQSAYLRQFRLPAGLTVLDHRPQ